MSKSPSFYARQLAESQEKRAEQTAIFLKMGFKFSELVLEWDDEGIDTTLRIMRTPYQLHTGEEPNYEHPPWRMAKEKFGDQG